MASLKDIIDTAFADRKEVGQELYETLMKNGLDTADKVKDYKGAFSEMGIIPARVGRLMRAIHEAGPKYYRCPCCQGTGKVAMT